MPEIRKDLLALDEALTRLGAVNLQAAQLVQMRDFAGLSIPECAEVSGISPRSADRLWAYARAWLHQEIAGSSSRCVVIKHHKSVGEHGAIAQRISHDLEKRNVVPLDVRFFR
ncbi:MAG: hypothetical protein KatS3mg108_1880 [Isosphaeraceae bacterium]|nr:MAG: hypothetical protein KatS3mg108_1880 [Isosphaeraceae bacterium]